MPVVLPSLVPSIVVPILEGSIAGITKCELVIVAERWWVVPLSIAIRSGRAGVKLIPQFLYFVPGSL